MRVVHTSETKKKKKKKRKSQLLLQEKAQKQMNLDKNKITGC